MKSFGDGRAAPHSRLFAVGYIVALAALWAGVIGGVPSWVGDAAPPAWSIVTMVSGGVGIWLLTWPLRKFRPALQTSANPYMVAWYRLVLGLEAPSAIRALRGTPAVEPC